MQADTPYRGSIMCFPHTECNFTAQSSNYFIYSYKNAMYIWNMTLWFSVLKMGLCFCARPTQAFCSDEWEVEGFLKYAWMNQNKVCFWWGKNITTWCEGQISQFYMNTQEDPGTLKWCTLHQSNGWITRITNWKHTVSIFAVEHICFFNSTI